MKIFDTKERRLVDLVPMDGKTIRMYTCGPTVYNYPHIGNLRTYTFEDFLRRAIRFFGMGVYQVMNLTDIDDKTIRGAIAKGVSLKEFTDVYTKAFFEDLATLHIEKAEQYPAATEHIPEMINIIQKLTDKGLAYKTETGDVFYRIARFPTYGALSHLPMHDLKQGVRVVHDEYDKESVSDFALWKAYDPDSDGDIFWEAPWGKGRPGWHIECSAMAMKYLGETFDLHMGGIDNMFPHHENEIAQSEGCTGKKFSLHWMHTEHLLVNGKKMSKSLGNFYTLRDLLAKGYTGREVRYMLLATHYRTQLNFTFEGLDAARQSLRRIDDFVFRVQREGAELDVEPFRKAFKEALANDMNSSEALAVLFDLVRQGNKAPAARGDSILSLLKEWDQVLGFVLPEVEEVPAWIVDKANKRIVARKEKNWALADTLRNEVDAAGYIVEDNTDGSFSLKKR